MNGTISDNRLDEVARLIEQGRRDEAIAACAALIEAEPDNAGACLTLGSLYGEGGDLARARELVARATRLEPGDPDAWLVLGHVLRAEGDLDGALDAFGHAVARAPGSAECRCVLGSLQLERGQVREATASFEQAVRCEAPGANAWLVLGMLRHQAGRPEQALECYRNAVGLEPDNARARGDLGSLLMMLDRPDEAETVAREGVRLCPGDVRLQEILAASLADQGRLSDALDALDAALAVSPDAQALVIRRADVQERRGDQEDALETLRPLLEADEVPLDAALIFAKFCIDLDMREEGRYLVRKAAEQAADMTQGQRDAVSKALKWIAER